MHKGSRIGTFAAIAGAALMVPAGVLATLNPTGVVMSSLIYTDTLFLFFVVCGLLAALRWLEAPRAAWAVSLGVAFGLVALTRALAAPFMSLSNWPRLPCQGICFRKS